MVPAPLRECRQRGGFRRQRQQRRHQRKERHEGQRRANDGLPCGEPPPDPAGYSRRGEPAQQVGAHHRIGGIDRQEIDAALRHRNRQQQHGTKAPERQKGRRRAQPFPPFAATAPSGASPPGQPAEEQRQPWQPRHQQILGIKPEFPRMAMSQGLDGALHAPQLVVVQPGMPGLGIPPLPERPDPNGRKTRRQGRRRDVRAEKPRSGDGLRTAARRQRMRDRQREPAHADQRDADRPLGQKCSRREHPAGQGRPSAAAPEHGRETGHGRHDEEGQQRIDPHPVHIDHVLRRRAEHQHRTPSHRTVPQHPRQRPGGRQSPDGAQRHEHARAADESQRRSQPGSEQAAQDEEQRRLFDERLPREARHHPIAALDQGLADAGVARLVRRPQVMPNDAQQANRQQQDGCPNRHVEGVVRHGDLPCHSLRIHASAQALGSFANGFHPKIRP